MRVTSYKKKNGKTYYKVQGYLGADPLTGRPVEISRSGFSSAFDARAHFAAELEAFRRAADLPGAPRERIRFEELFDLWLPIYRRGVSEATLAKTLQHFRLYIMPDLGGAWVDKIAAFDLSKMAHAWSLRTNSAGKIFRFVSRVLDLGVSFGYLSENVAAGVAAPKKVRPRRDAALEFLERDVLVDYLAAAEEHLARPWYIYIHLLAMTGLRRGEALALLPSDLSGDILRIDKTLTTGVDGQIVGPPKTPRSNRSIRIDRDTVALLSELFVAPDRPIFAKSDGSYWSLSRPRHWMVKLAERAGVPKISPHILRHTHCALMFESGAGLSEVQDRLGHDSLDITLRIYNHVSNRTRHLMVDRFVDYLGVGKKSVEFKVAAG